MATFSVRFLGCKVSHTDAQDVRERAARATATHERAGRRRDVAVVNTCCVTHEAVRKSRQAAARAARTHARVYVTGCAREPRRRRVRRAAGERRRRRAAQRGDAGLRRRRRRRDRLRAGRRASRARARVREDPGRLQLLVRVLRRSRSCAAARAAGRAAAVLAEIRRRVAQGHREVVLTGINLGLLPRPRRRLRAAAARPRGRRRRRLERLRLSSIEVNHVDAELVAALRETPTVGRHLHVPLQSGDDGVLRAMGRRYTVDDVPAPARAARRLQPDDRRDRRLPGRGRARVRAHARGGRARPASRRCTSSRTRRGPARGTAAADTVPPAVKKERSARLRAASDEACLRSLAREARRARTSSSSTGPAAATATTTRRGSSTRRSGELAASARAAVTEEGIVAA